MFKHEDYFMMKYEWYRSLPRKEVKVGEKFGKWTVIENVRYKNPDWDYDPDALWLCECVCGRHRRLTSDKLNIIVRDKQRGFEDGCGLCTKPYKPVERPFEWKLKRRIYRTWANMRQRCNNPNHSLYKYYGERRIKVCEEWNAKFQPFYEYVSSLEHFNEPGTSLDRIDNDGNYCPGNVRWATAKQQCNNRRPRKKKIDVIKE